MTRPAILAASLALSACTATPQMVERQKSVCAEIGYPVGSPAHLVCTERMTLYHVEAWNRTAISVASIATTATLNQLLWELRK